MKQPHDAATTFLVGFLGGLAIGFLIPIAGWGWTP
jgi:hypothetical protein